MDHTRQVLSTNEIRRGKTALREDVKTGMIAKCIQMNGVDYSQTSKWHKLTKIGVNTITFDWHRDLDVRGKTIVYSTYRTTSGRFLKIYEKGNLSALYALKAL